MVREGSSEGFEKGRSITLKKLWFRKKDKNGFVNSCEMFERVEIPPEPLYIPCEDNKLFWMCISRRIVRICQFKLTVGAAQ